MTTLYVLLTTTLAMTAGVLGTLNARHRRQHAEMLAPGPKRILFPFAGHALSRRALDAALRLALADHATLVPVFLLRVPMQLALDSPLPRQCGAGLPLLETIEQRAAALGVPVDARVDRGRTLRHAMRQAMAHERFDRLVVAAAGTRSEGFQSEDVAWLLDHAPGEVVIIRAAEDHRIGARLPPRQPTEAPGPDSASSAGHPGAGIAAFDPGEARSSLMSGASC
jgi:nucleotide-binding universal stress UspA family protein